MLLLEERGLGRERSPKKEWQHLADERKFYALRERTAGEHGSFRWRGAEEGERVGRVFYARFWKAKWNPAVKAIVWVAAAAAAKSLQSCPTLCDPTDGSPPDSPVPGILQARTLEWGAISFSNAWKWKVKVKSLSPVRLFATHGLQPTRLLRSWDSPGKSTGVGCHLSV